MTRGVIDEAKGVMPIILIPGKRWTWVTIVVLVVAVIVPERLWGWVSGLLGIGTYRLVIAEDGWVVRVIVIHRCEWSSSWCIDRSFMVLTFDNRTVFNENETELGIIFVVANFKALDL